jgi:hypothetical protein
MKEILQIKVAIPSLGLLTNFAVPAFVHEPRETEAVPTCQETRGAMHEAYEDDEWEVIAQASMR